MYYLSFLFIDNIILLTFQCEDNSCRITHTVQWDAFYFREIWFKINENLYVWWRLQFTLSSLPWWGDFDAMVLSKLASSDEISWWRCNVIIGTLSQSPNCNWNWSHVTFNFVHIDMSCVEGIICTVAQLQERGLEGTWIR